MAWGAGRSLSNLLGIVITEIGDEYVTVTMPVDEFSLQPHGRLHGGALVVLAETLGPMAANFTLDPTQQIAVGLDVNANHVRTVRDGMVHATARPETLSRTT